MSEPDERYMQIAIDEATKAREAGDIAIGAVIVRNNELVVRVGHRTRTDNDVTQHAEMVAIREAEKILGIKYLDGCTLYTTHEPCPMCTTAAYFAKLAAIVSGAFIEDMAEYRSRVTAGTVGWRTLHLSPEQILNSAEPKQHIRVTRGFMREQCKALFHP